MCKTENLFKNTINEIQNLWKTNKNLSKFVSWPQDLKFTNSQNKRIAVTDKLSSWNINDQSSNCQHTPVFGVGQKLALNLLKI